MNLFEAKQNKKRRRPIINEQLQKGSTNRNATKISVASTERNLCLIAELRREGRKSCFVDNQLKGQRGSLNDAASTARRIHLLQKKKKKLLNQSAFNLSGMNGSFNSTDHLGKLNKNELMMTHGGRPITDIDDFSMEDTDYEQDLLDNHSKEFIPVTGHFGGGDIDTTQFKTRKEIYEEIITKAKQAKLQRIREKNEQEEQLDKLDNAFTNLQDMLKYNPPKRALVETSQDKDNLDYNQLLKSFTFQPRACPTDRVKSSAELAADRAARFELLEKLRLQRMELDMNKDPVSDTDNSISQSNNDSEQEVENSDDDEDDVENSDDDKETNLSDTDSSLRDAKELMEDDFYHDSNSFIDIPEQSNTNQIQSVMLSNNKIDEVSPNITLNTNIDSKNILLLQKTEHFMKEDILDEDVPSYAKNDPVPWEINLPFRIPFPKNSKELTRLLNKETPIGQNKLLHRLRVAYDSRLHQDNHKNLSKLLSYLIEYLINSLTEQFKDNTNLFYKHTEYTTVPSSIHVDSIAVFESLEEHLLDLSNQYPDVISLYCGTELLKACITCFPNIKDEFNTLKDFKEWDTLLTEQQQSMTNQNMSINSIRMTPKDLSLIYLISHVYPKSDLRHPIITPTLILIDFWAMQLSEMGHWPFTPINTDRLTERNSCLNNSSIESFNHFPVFSDVNLRYSFILFGIQMSIFTHTSQFSSSIIPLSCSILHHLSITSTTENSSKRLPIINLLCNAIKEIFQVVSHKSKVTSLDVLIKHVALPTTYSILSLQQNNSVCIPKTILTIITDFEQFLISMSQCPNNALHLAPLKPQGIQMLTPKYVEGNTKAGARYLRLRGATEEEVAQKKLKRDVQSARRGAARQLRRDAEFLNAVKATEKRKHDMKLEANYKKVIKTLEQDREDIHKMRTSVVAGGTVRRTKFKKRPQKEKK